MQHQVHRITPCKALKKQRERNVKEQRGRAAELATKSVYGSFPLGLPM